MFNFNFERNFERRKVKGRPATTIKIPERKAGYHKAPEPSFLASVIENDIWIIESIENDSFVCRMPSAAELIRIREYIKNPYTENDYVRPFGEI